LKDIGRILYLKGVNIEAFIRGDGDGLDGLNQQDVMHSHVNHREYQEHE